MVIATFLCIPQCKQCNHTKAHLQYRTKSSSYSENLIKKIKYLNQRKRGCVRERTIWSNQRTAYDKEESQEAKAKSKRRTIPHVSWQYKQKAF